MANHNKSCPAYGNYQPPYEECNCGADEVGERPRAALPKHLIELGIEVSGWSPCQSKRGVVIFSGENVVTHGYNYKPRGFECDGSAACKATCRTEAVHAEQQALLVAGGSVRGAEMLHVKTVNGALVPSGGPTCVQCSKLALASGIAGMWLFHEDGWRRYDMAEFHRLSLASPVLPPDTPEQLQAFIETLPLEQFSIEWLKDKMYITAPKADVQAYWRREVAKVCAAFLRSRAAQEGKQR